MALDVKRLKRLMMQKSITQRDLAQMSGVTEAAMSRYIGGNRQPRRETLANMATALHTTSDYLLGRVVKSDELQGALRLVARNVNDIPEKVRLELIRLLADAERQISAKWRI